MDNEVSIKLRLDTSDLAVSTSAKTNAPEKNAKAERAAASALLAQQRMSDLERFENRLTRRMSKFGIRATAGLAIGGISEVIGMQDNFFSRMGTSAIMGMAFGGPPAAAMSVIMQSVGEAMSKLREHWESIMQIRKTVLALEEVADGLKRGGEERIRELDMKFEEKLSDLRDKLRVESDELVYQTGQYIED
jgi:hypothetical protein